MRIRVLCRKPRLRLRVFGAAQSNARRCQQFEHHQRRWSAHQVRDCVPYSLLYIPGFPPGHCTYKCCRKETYSSVWPRIDSCNSSRRYHAVYQGTGKLCSHDKSHRRFLQHNRQSLDEGHGNTRPPPSVSIHIKPNSQQLRNDVSIYLPITWNALAE